MEFWKTVLTLIAVFFIVDCLRVAVRGLYALYKRKQQHRDAMHDWRTGIISLNQFIACADESETKVELVIFEHKALTTKSLVEELSMDWQENMMLIRDLQVRKKYGNYVVSKWQRSYDDYLVIAIEKGE